MLTDYAIPGPGGGQRQMNTERAVSGLGPVQGLVVRPGVETDNPDVPVLQIQFAEPDAKMFESQDCLYTWPLRQLG